MEDDQNILANGRRPQYLDKWKTTSVFLKMEEDLNICCQIEYDLIILDDPAGVKNHLLLYIFNLYIFF